MKKRILHVEISSLEESLNQFGKALEHTIEGVELEPYEGIGFEDLGDLLSTLTPKRWELIRCLRLEGPMTLYALAKTLEWDYKNVRLDVKTLEEWGIIERDEEKRVLVPWDEIDVRVPLAA